MIKNCYFCLKLFGDHIEPVMINYNKLIKTPDNYQTKINNISRCAKCKKVYGCNECSENVKTHYKTCCELEDNGHNNFIFTNISNKPEFNFIVLPKEFGGGIVNLKHVNYLDKCTIYKFHETTHILISITDDENNIIKFWTDDDQFIIQHNLKKSIGEKLCFQIMNDVLIFNEKSIGYYKFEKIRPKWLRCSYSNSPLELDMFNEELKIAVEFNGEQHYKFIPYFHRTEDNFNKQLLRDTEKKEKCRRLGITLIIVPFSCKNFKEVEKCILEQLPEVR